MTAAPDTCEDRPASRHWRDALLLGLAALALSSVMVFELVRWPGFHASTTAGTDMEVYVQQARGIHAGSWPEAKPFYRAPLYPYALAAMGRLTRSKLGLALLQGLLFALAVGLTTRAACIDGGRYCGLAAGLVLLFYGGAVYWAAFFHSTIVELFLGALFLFLWALWRSRFRALEDDAPAYGSPALVLLAALGGLVFACLCLVRPNFLVLTPFVAVGMWLEAKPPRQRRRMLVLLLTACVCIAAPLALVVWRNNQHSDRFVLLTTNAYRTFALTNATDAGVFNFNYTKGPVLSPLTLAFWRRQALKALGYWWSVEYPQNVNFYLVRAESMVLRFLALVPFGLIGALFLVSSGLAARTIRRHWPYWVFFWGYYLSIIPFFIIGRFRVPAVPAMAVIAGFGLVEIHRQWRAGRRRLVAAAAAAFAVLLAATQPWASRISENDYYNVGMASLYRLDMPRAEVYLRHGYGIAKNRDCGVLLAVALAGQNRLYDARQVMLDLHRTYPDKADYLHTSIVLTQALSRPEELAEMRAVMAERFAGAAATDVVTQGVMYFHQEEQKLRRTDEWLW